LALARDFFARARRMGRRDLDEFVELLSQSWLGRLSGRRP
jgi:hypothetical protein